MRHKTKFKHEKVEGRARGEAVCMKQLVLRSRHHHCVTQQSVEVKTEEVIESQHGIVFINLLAM
jgi:hypothetical protein